MPNGRSNILERQQGADAGGYSGLEDEVDNHWAELFKAALLSTILGVGAELGAGADNGNNTDILQALRFGVANSLNQTGQQVTRRNLNIQPTLTIKSGFPVGVIVCQPRSRTGAIPRMTKMAKLRIAGLTDDKPVKVTVELPSSIHRDLVAYADYLNGQHVSVAFREGGDEWRI